MKSKSAYTLIEGLISMLLIGIVSVTAIGFASGYFKDTFRRDVQTKAVIENINTLEKVKAEVITLSQLYTFSQENDIKIIAVGIGEIQFSESGEMNIISDEKYGFSQKLLTDEPTLFRIEIGGDIPNTKLITIIRLGDNVKKKRCFTVVEVLIASSILLVVITAGISLLLLINTLLYDSQIESSNRTSLNDAIFYLTREIQSAEGVIISSDGKEMKIKQRGSEGYSLRYTITENYPVDYFAFKGKRLIDIDCEGSSFSFEGKGIVITLQIVKNNIELNQIPQEVSFEIVPRSDSVVLEINN